MSNLQGDESAIALALAEPLGGGLFVSNVVMAAVLIVCQKTGSVSHLQGHVCCSIVYGLQHLMPLMLGDMLPFCAAHAAQSITETCMELLWLSCGNTDAPGSGQHLYLLLTSSP
jgi:hypothetical protein